MATPIAGTGGHIYISGTPDVAVAEIKEWEIEIDREQYDASTLGVTWRKKVPGIGSFSGKLTGFFSVSSDAGQTIVQNAILNGTQLQGKFETSTNIYEGTFNPSKLTVKNPVDGIVTFDCDFEGDGQLYFS